MKVTVAGVGMQQFGRFPELSLKDLARVAVVRALDDAGLGVKDIEAVYSANAMAGLLQGQEQIRGQATLRDVGIERVPIVNVENACASGSTAFRQAILADQGRRRRASCSRSASRRCSSRTATGRSPPSRAPRTSTSSPASGSSSPPSTRCGCGSGSTTGR